MIEIDDRLVLGELIGIGLADLRISRSALTSKPVPFASAKTSLMSSAMVFFSSSRRSMRSMKDFSCSLAKPAAASESG